MFGGITACGITGGGTTGGGITACDITGGKTAVGVKIRSAV